MREGELGNSKEENTESTSSNHWACECRVGKLTFSPALGNAGGANEASSPLCRFRPSHLEKAGHIVPPPPLLP